MEKYYLQLNFLVKYIIFDEIIQCFLLFSNNLYKKNCKFVGERGESCSTMEENRRVIQEYWESDKFLRVKEDVLPFISTPLHYHSQYELVWIKEGYGIRTVGDCTESFAAGDMVLMCPNMPHVWENDEAFYKGDPALRSDVYVIHFHDDAVMHLNHICDMPFVKAVLKLSRRGVQIVGRTNQNVARIMEECQYAVGVKRIICFLQILSLVADGGEDLKPIASESFLEYYDDMKSTRMRQVDEYIGENFGKKIVLDEIAGALCMSVSSFCRYFKEMTGTTFVNYLTDYRIKYAKRLLKERRLKIVSIAEITGFDDVSYFNRTFKRKTGMTPTEYWDSLHV